MYKIIGGDGREYGPVSADQLRQWVAEGRANAQTRVQPEGSTEWVALGTVPEFAGTAGVVPPPAPAELATDLAARAYTLDLGGCIRRGWELVKTNLGLLLGVTVLTFLLIGAASAVPFVGGIIGIVVDGPLMAGLYLVFLKRLRGEEATVGNMFDGFRLAFGQCILGYLVPSLLAGLLILPGAICLGIGIVAHQHTEAAGFGLIGVGAVLLVLALPVAVYLSIGWLFTLPLIIDKRLDFWPAMKLSRAIVQRHWWSWFGLALLAGLISMLGVLLCCVGMLFTIPIALAALMYGYEDAFGSRAAATP